MRRKKVRISRIFILGILLYPNVGLGWQGDSVVCGGWSNGWLYTNPMDREFGTLTAPFHAGQTEKFRCEASSNVLPMDAVVDAIGLYNLTFVCLEYDSSTYTAYTDDGSGIKSYEIKCTGYDNIGCGYNEYLPDNGSCQACPDGGVTANAWNQEKTNCFMTGAHTDASGTYLFDVPCYWSE